MSDERFARQYRYEPPPGFPLASPCSGIVHHLSGPNMYAHTQTSTSKGSGRQRVYRTCFHCASGFATPKLAHMLDSLVRVSRRGDQKHFVVEIRHHDRVQSTMSWSFPAAANSDDLRPATVRWSRVPAEDGRAPTLLVIASFSAISGTL